MSDFTTNDGVRLHYRLHGVQTLAPLILIHGFTGSSAVWSRNVQTLSSNYHVIVPDLRGHGASGKPKHGYHVSRLAMDLRELLVHLGLDQRSDVRAIGGSLGCSILWCYSELFTTTVFSHMVFVDQAPLQNSTLDGWDSTFCNRGMNNSNAVAALQATLALAPDIAYRGTIAACLSYRSHPRADDNIKTGSAAAQSDEDFFLAEAQKGEPEWYGRLMSDHTSLDWRHSIPANFGEASRSKTRVLVVATDRSGCFPSAGPLAVVDLVNGQSNHQLAQGVVVDWGGHWCYWEDPDKFNDLALDFLKR